MEKAIHSPKVHEKEVVRLPWAQLTSMVLDLVVAQAKPRSTILDLMCGPGYLLGKINKLRPDIKLTGVDIDARYVSFARRKYRKIEFEKSDVLKWHSNSKFDVVLCTGALHHVPYVKQKAVVKKISGLMAQGAICIIADSYISNYSNEIKRRQAAATLGYAYLNATIERNSSREIISEAIDILHNDVLGFEYKTSVQNSLKLFKKHFKTIEIHKIWPSEKTEYGDYFFVMKK